MAQVQYASQFEHADGRWTGMISRQVDGGSMSIAATAKSLVEVAIMLALKTEELGWLSGAARAAIVEAANWKVAEAANYLDKVQP